MQAVGVARGASPLYRNFLHATRDIVAKEGVGRLFRGITAVVLGSGPAHAVYFAAYEEVKGIFEASGMASTQAASLAGGAATLVHDSIMVRLSCRHPLTLCCETLCSLLTIQCNTRYGTAVHCDRSLQCK
jgi:transmembrane carrier protein